MPAAIDTLDNLIREELPATINESLPQVAPVYNYIKQTSLGVQRSGIGRDWEVIHLFGVGVAGLMQNASPAGPEMFDNTRYPQVHILKSGDATLTPFPAAVDAPHTLVIRRTLKLHMSTGNFSIPITWIQGDALDASQVEQVVREIKAVGELRAQTEAVSFFMGAANSLCQIASTPAHAMIDTNKGVTFSLETGTGRINYFRVGMCVDIYNNNSGVPGGTKRNTGLLIVSDVDYLNGRVTAVVTNPTSGTVSGIAAGDHVVLGNLNLSYEMRSFGLEDWIKDSGTILGGASGAPALDLSAYSQFKSLVSNVGGALTDSVMNKTIGKFLDSYPGASLDTIITTMGVTLKHLEQPGSASTMPLFYDRTGKPLSVHGGWSDIKYSFNGKMFNWLISPLCITGRLYAVKFADGNVKRYVPPKVGGSDSRIGDEIQFLAPLAGSSNIFLPGRASTGAPQAILEAPFWQYILVCPVDVRGVKLTGLTEAS